MANCVFLTGRLTKDPMINKNGATTIAKFNLAIDRYVKNGEKQTDFPSVVVFGKQAENCEKFLTKGKLVAIQGSIKTSSYKNKDGVTVYTTDVIADRVEFLEWGEKKQDSEPQQHEGFSEIDTDELPF